MYLRGGNDGQFLAHRLGVDGQFGLRGGGCVSFLIESAVRCQRLPLLLRCHGDLLGNAKLSFSSTFFFLSVIQSQFD